MTENQKSTGCCCPPPEILPKTTGGCCSWTASDKLVKEDVSRPATNVETPAGKIPGVSTSLSSKDRLSTWKVRWGIGRMRYRVEPGLYAVGNPTAQSIVLVSSNFKLSFDRLRSQLGGIDAWILVLDTKGINVWCAAGKGTFGTDELVNRIRKVGLDKVVSHRRLILPQLSAPGVSAHRVKQLSGFKVIYGPVRARDIKGFLAAGMQASAEMRRVRFPITDRVALVPVELMGILKYAIPIAAAFFVLSGLHSGGYSLPRMLTVGSWSALVFFAGCVWAVALTPTLLPWLPGRSFSIKGATLGLVFAIAASVLARSSTSLFEDYVTLAGWVLIVPAVSSFLAMNFTGASTYTSLSGVKKEMRVAVPIQIVGAAIGLGLWVAGRFV